MDSSRDKPSNSYMKPPPAKTIQPQTTQQKPPSIKANTSPQQQDYAGNVLNRNPWLNQHVDEVKDLLGLELSGTFEQMEQIIKARFEAGNQQNTKISQPKHDFVPILEGDSRQDSLDLTGIDTFVDNTKTIQKTNHIQQANQNVVPTSKEQPSKTKEVKPASKVDAKSKPHAKNLGAHIFDCDVSEIPANRQNRTGISEDSRSSNMPSNRLASKQSFLNQPTVRPASAVH